MNIKACTEDHHRLAEHHHRDGYEYVHNRSISCEPCHLEAPLYLRESSEEEITNNVVDFIDGCIAKRKLDMDLLNLLNDIPSHWKQIVLRNYEEK